LLLPITDEQRAAEQAAPPKRAPPRKPAPSAEDEGQGSLF